MIVFQRTENVPQYGDTPYDDIKLEISGGYETNIDDYIHYFVVFLEALTFQRESVIDGFRDWIESEAEVKRRTG